MSKFGAFVFLWHIFLATKAQKHKITPNLKQKECMLKMSLIYSLFLYIYYFLIFIASVFNKKAKFWINGRKNLMSDIKESVNLNDETVWIHCASLGEFEQGRPVIEKLKEGFPGLKIVLTFFSPSGYEIRKNYEIADHVFYLPLDSAGNAKKFVQIINPIFAVFIKYEFWFNYLEQLYKNNIPVFLVSANFRENQVFFKWYGKWYRKLLKRFKLLFVQNERSQKLLNSIGIKNSIITGDTRFDRVIKIASQKQSVKEIESFINKNPIIVAGSTWEKDEDLLVPYINSSDKSFKTIIAPHEINQKKIELLRQHISKKCILYSEISQQDLTNYEVLIIDTIGLLSRIYRYADIAYIGGGFGNGIHNILEAAAFGLPIIFGPNHSNFQEALDLIDLKAAFPLNNYNKLKAIIDKLLADQYFLNETGKISSKYITSNAGSTVKIINKIAENTALSNS